MPKLNKRKIEEPSSGPTKSQKIPSISYLVDCVKDPRVSVLNAIVVSARFPDSEKGSRIPFECWIADATGVIRCTAFDISKYKQWEDKFVVGKLVAISGFNIGPLYKSTKPSVGKKFLFDLEVILTGKDFMADVQTPESSPLLFWSYLWNTIIFMPPYARINFFGQIVGIGKMEQVSFKKENSQLVNCLSLTVRDYSGRDLRVALWGTYALEADSLHSEEVMDSFIYIQGALIREDNSNVFRLSVSDQGEMIKPQVSFYHKKGAYESTFQKLMKKYLPLTLMDRYEKGSDIEYHLKLKQLFPLLHDLQQEVEQDPEEIQDCSSNSESVN